MRPPRKLMELLDKQGALSASEAGEILGLSRSHMTRQGKNLVTRGWARAMQDPDDRRVILYDLTRAGRKVLDNSDEYDRKRLLSLIRLEG